MFGILVAIAAYTFLNIKCTDAVNEQNIYTHCSRTSVPVLYPGTHIRVKSPGCQS